MPDVFVNLKRFDVPRSRGGICPDEDPERWIANVIRDTAGAGLEGRENLRIVFLLPESLLLSALRTLDQAPERAQRLIAIGCQGVFREDVQAGRNFGAFTTNLPAQAAANMGVRWSIIGHSEERKDHLGVIESYDPGASSGEARTRALRTVDSIVNAEALCALRAGINALVCMGETAGERGEGPFDEQKPRVQAALRAQVGRGLADVKPLLADAELVIGYEPIWAIGPGKTPPDGDYIGFVASCIKEAAREYHGLEVRVVYGGGLKEANATMIGGVGSIDGGLVALTKFTDPIGFDPADLAVIIDNYAQGESGR